jgi:molecular chaperone IbpA
MRTNLNFSPLFPSTIGFDRVFDLLENANRVQIFENWPPNDIVRISEDAYRIIMAVSGFAEHELTLTHEPNLLVVSGQNSADAAGEFCTEGFRAKPSSGGSKSPIMSRYSARIWSMVC